ncbi:hypothetical protein [Rhizobium sp. ZPR3]|uniref:CopG family transcriptional regulator n=2 Tax=unclassified Rhizobium TaxID=2613769 RepID=A0AAU7SFB9_9HYPH
MPGNENSLSERSADKITLRLSNEARATLEWIAEYYGNISLNEAMRRALGTERFLLEEKQKGSTILIEERGGRVKEIVLR